jgi:hypothetical protein
MSQLDRSKAMSDQGPWVTKTILELEERVAELTEEIEHLEDLIIKLGQMLREIVNITKGPPEENTLHSTHDAVESVERLQARVAELHGALVLLREPWDLSQILGAETRRRVENADRVLRTGADKAGGDL